MYIFLTSEVRLLILLLNMVVQFIVFLTLSTLICRGTDISKCFTESLGIRDNESRLYIKPYVYVYYISVISTAEVNTMINNCKVDWRTWNKTATYDTVVINIEQSSAWPNVNHHTDRMDKVCRIGESWQRNKAVPRQYGIHYTWRKILHSAVCNSQFSAILYTSKIITYTTQMLLKNKN